MLSHAVLPGNPVRFLAVAAAWAALAAAAPSLDTTDHNARVAEHLLLQHREAGDRNARVAEYLLGPGDSVL
jgi:hypothetical protein